MPEVKTTGNAVYNINYHFVWTARQLFAEFPELLGRLWGGHLWAPSYYVGTAGNVSAETIRRYIEETQRRC